MASRRVADTGVSIPDRETKVFRRRKLTAAPIRKTEFASLWEAMQEDGVSFVSSIDGYTFMVGAYEVSNKELGRVWELSPSALNRFIAWQLDGRCFNGRRG